MAEKSCSEYPSEQPCKEAGCTWDADKKSCRKGGGSAIPFLILLAIAGAILLVKHKKCTPFLRFSFGVPKSGKITVAGPEGFFFQTDQALGIFTLPLPGVGKYSYKIEAEGYKDKNGVVAVGCEGFIIDLKLIPA